jgi:hypothetical protein
MQAKIRIVRFCVWAITMLPPAALGCGGVGPLGLPVTFGDQSNIIVWNAKAKTEHFIRWALFDSKAKDFGFIAPTPSKPELSEASQEAFMLLAGLAPGMAGAASTGGASAGDVNVVQEQNVGRYHATTLLASDEKALARWMTKHHYKSTPAIEEWTHTYIKKGWYLTAFRLRGGRFSKLNATVRMSFKTDLPFNPFRVPSDNVGPKKSMLRVFFVSDRNFDATVGQKALWKMPSWSSPLNKQIVAELGQQLKLPTSAFPANPQVQSFVDYEFPRTNADDVFFSPTLAEAKVTLPEGSSLLNPFVVGIGGCGILYTLLSLNRKRRRRALVR